MMTGKMNLVNTIPNSSIRYSIVVFVLFIYIIYLTYFYITGDVDKISKLVTARQHSLSMCTDNSPIVVLMDPIQNNKLFNLGGTGHWFHFTEYLHSSLPDFQKDVWSQAAEHRSVYIVFQEENSPTNIGEMGKILLTSIVTGGLFESVFVGFADTLGFANASQFLVLDNFQEVFSVHRNASATSSTPSNLQIKDKANIRRVLQSDTRLCFRLAYHHHWHRLQRYHWFNKSAENYQHFRDAVGRVCSTTLDPISNIHYPRRPGVPDDISLGSGPFQRTKKWLPDGQLLPAAAIVDNPDIVRKVVVYQRDHSRILLNAEEVTKRLSEQLSGVDPSLATTSAALRGSQTPASYVNRSLHADINKKLPKWQVDLVVHSPSRSACDVVKIIRTATVLVTPHGFQSTLILFQPTASLIVEIEPHLYSQPTVYGTILAGFRMNMQLPRSMLFEESTPSKWMHLALSLLRLIGLGGICNSATCTRYGACRYISRLQDVHMSNEFTDRAANFIKQQFP